MVDGKLWNKMQTIAILFYLTLFQTYSFDFYVNFVSEYAEKSNH